MEVGWKLDVVKVGKGERMRSRQLVPQPSRHVKTGVWCPMDGTLPRGVAWSICKPYSTRDCKTITYGVIVNGCIAVTDTFAFSTDALAIHRRTRSSSRRVLIVLRHRGLARGGEQYGESGGGMPSGKFSKRR